MEEPRDGRCPGSLSSRGADIKRYRVHSETHSDGVQIHSESGDVSAGECRDGEFCQDLAVMPVVLVCQLWTSFK